MTGPESPHPVPAADLPGARLEHALRQRKTPLLRIASAAGAVRGEGRVLAKLESLRPAGCIDDRALGAWDDALAAGSQARTEKAHPGASDPHRAARSGDAFAARLPSSAVLAGAGWARARGISLRAIVHGPITHEVSETLLLWGTQVVRAGSRSEADALARQAAADGLEPLPPLDGSRAAQAVERSLGAELVEQLREERAREAKSSEAKSSEAKASEAKASAEKVSAEKVSAGTRDESQRGAALVAPISAGLAGAFSALRASFPRLRGYALCAATQDDLLPELPSRGEAEALLAELAAHWGQGASIELVPISRAQAQQARAQLARSHGLSASHASAASVAHALELRARDPSAFALALVTATGEREFSLDPAR